MRVDAYECDWCHRREIDPGDGWREITHHALPTSAPVIEHACRSCWADIVGLRSRAGRSVGAAPRPDDGDSLTAVHGRLMRTVRRVYEEHDVAPGGEPNTDWAATPPDGWERTD